jgi:outer membrane protein assembly factor BamB
MKAVAKGLRLWPGVALVAILWLVRIFAPMIDSVFFKFFLPMFIVPLSVLAGMFIWWLFASRLRWSDRLWIVLAFIAVTLGTIALCDPSFRGPALLVYTLPYALTAWVGWLLVSWFLTWPVRRAGLVLVLLGAGVASCLLRMDGVNGDFVAHFSWRWTPTAEDRLLAELKNKAPVSARVENASPLGEQPGDWPEFRGPRRDGRLTGVEIKTDWQSAPPKELWRHRIGPGWSSLCVVGERCFTQEQRGDDEYVVCYDAGTGKAVWEHHDATRFSEMVAGPGPRATPTFHAGRLYTYGANSHLNCLDAATGKPVWMRDVAEDCKTANKSADKSSNKLPDADKDIPQWGFASSPLVTSGMVVVFAGARQGKTLTAYHEGNGDPAWTSRLGPAPESGAPDKPALSYCSPQLVTLGGIEQILLATDAGVSGFEPSSGKELWHFSSPVPNTPRIIQPALVEGGDVLVGTGMGNGTKRFHVSRDGDQWRTEEKWLSRKIRPYFNDIVVYRDYLYGFDTGKVVCVSLDDGTEAWHARGYGNGQVLLLADQGLLLILTEEGEVALVRATPEKRDELCRFKAVEGKTWNHPVIAHGKLFVRNGEEIACFKL